MIFLAEYTSHLNIASLEAALQGACHYADNSVTGWSGVSTLLLSEIASLICNFCPSVAGDTILFACPSALHIPETLSNQETNTNTWLMHTYAYQQTKVV